MATQHLIRVPASMDFGGTLELLGLLEVAPAVELYLFDFGEMSWVTPLGLVLGSTILRQFRSERQRAKFTALNFDETGYPAQMGFFQAFGLPKGKAPGQAPGGHTYEPITCISLADLYSDARAARQPVQEAIDRRAIAITRVLTRADSGPLADTLSYSIREMFRNSAEHSGTTNIWYSAQYWPTKEEVHVAIVDEGVGIRPTLQRNPHLTIESDDHALSLALLPGVSGAAFKGARQYDTDVWQHSGYGLFMTSRLCASGGRFFIGSGVAGLILDGARKERLHFPFAGVAIELVLSTKNLPALCDSLEALNREGTAIAKNLRGTPLDATTASRMLIRDQ